MLKNSLNNVKSKMSQKASEVKIWYRFNEDEIKAEVAAFAKSVVVSVAIVVVTKVVSEVVSEAINNYRNPEPAYNLTVVFDGEMPTE